MDSGEQDFIKLFFTEGHALSVEATRDCVKEMNMQCCHYELKEGLSMKLRTLKNGLYPFNGEEYDC